jgi:hypothetical protein
MFDGVPSGRYAENAGRRVGKSMLAAAMRDFALASGCTVILASRNHICTVIPFSKGK